MEFHANIYARKQLELGNQAYGLNNVQDAERFWNHAMKSACTVTCYDHGVIFLASYKLALLYSQQQREIERNVAIHQAFTAYDRVFQDHESYSASPPFQSLIQQLQQLRMISLNQNISSPIFSPSITSADSSAEKRHVYQKHEICQLRGILGDIEVPPAVQSYQSIVHIPESPPIKRNSNKKSQNKKKSSGFSPNSATSDRQNWSSPVGRSLDNILNEAVGHDHYIVSDQSSEIVEQSRILSSTEDHDDGEVGSS